MGRKLQIVIEEWERIKATRLQIRSSSIYYINFLYQQSVIEIECERTAEIVSGILYFIFFLLYRYFILTTPNDIGFYKSLITHSEKTVDVSLTYLELYIQSVDEMPLVAATNVYI